MGIFVSVGEGALVPLVPIEGALVPLVPTVGALVPLLPTVGALVPLVPTVGAPVESINVVGGKVETPFGADVIFCTDGDGAAVASGASEAPGVGG